MTISGVAWTFFWDGILALGAVLFLVSCVRLYRNQRGNSKTDTSSRDQKIRAASAVAALFAFMVLCIS